MDLYWHDYETFGIDPRRDRPSQFAGIRTDEDLNVIDDPLVIYCKPPVDYLPNPEACVLTGITPQFADENGLAEVEFCRQIQVQIAKPGTCTLGYNSLRFDDEFTRNCLYRNFYDPYAREWQNGNSRWDLIDLVRATKALRPDGIDWPTDAEGRACFRLEELTKANGISHEAAHDALSDVYATIALAKLIKRVQPRLYQFIWQNRNKTGASKLLQLGSFTPVLHVSGRIASARGCLTVVLPICRHPTNNNGVIVYDLSVDPEPLLILNAYEIQQRLYTAVADLPEGINRIPLKTVHINKCPVLAPITVLRTQDQDRLSLDLELCQRNLDKIKRRQQGLTEKLAEVFLPPGHNAVIEDDPDLMLYSGGFLPDRDKHKTQSIPLMTLDELTGFKPAFIDQRLAEMVFRYRARNYPESLNNEEASLWRQFCLDKLSGKQAGAGLTFDDYHSKIAELREQGNTNVQFLEQLENFAVQKLSELNALS